MDRRKRIKYSRSDHYLSDDLIGVIFERLPAKSVVRFRCLSKSWLSRIATHGFIRRHCLQSSNKVLIRKWEGSLRDRDFRMLSYFDVKKIKDSYAFALEDQFSLCHQPGAYLESETSTNKFPFHLAKIVNSCNGILCLLDDDEQHIILWNPSIRRKLNIPDHPSFYDNGLFISVGFGFDSINDDYKIVIICYSIDEYGYRTAEKSFVYSLNTSVWSSIAFTRELDCLGSEACFLNGALHWVSKPTHTNDLIVTFNLSSHVFGKISLPKHGLLYTFKEPTIIDGCLSVISFDQDYCWVSVMKEYNNVASWEVCFKLRTNRQREIKGVMQLPTTNGYFLIRYRGGLEVYNPVTGVRFALFEKELFKVIMLTCLDSLELLDSGEVES